MAAKIKKCQISIIAPVYNESKNLFLFYERTKKVLENMKKTFEIIFINDGSKDDSFDKMLKLYKKDTRVKIINLSRNFGKEIAMTSGLDYSSGETVIPIDTDLQDPPELIPKLYKKWEEGYDVIYATRSKRKGETWTKKWTAGLFYKVINIFTKFSIPENTGDFRLMDRKVVEAIKTLKEYHRFMKGLFSWVGFKQTGIYYERDPRFKGKSKWNYWKLLNFAIEGITSFSYAPLKFATFFGSIISFFSFIYALFVVFKTLILGIDQPGYASTLVVVLFLGGIQLLTIGIIGEYIGRIYNESKHRTLYFARDVYGFDKKKKIK
ncbi:MAG: glycosyltransferase family 2 protein [Spirochaetes bacterium]|nr:glycosyltransferase family 2 protein [Spirochaetota bacterium]